MRRAIAAWVTAAVLCGPSPRAGADTLGSIYGGELAETSHVVRIRVEEGFARYVVRRTVRNTGAISDELGLDIELPTGAVAVGLRVRSRGRWRDARLEEAELAARRYAALTDIVALRAGRERTARRRPTLLSWTTPGSLSLKTFPVRAREEVTFEYTLLVPTCFADGRIWLDYPMPTGGELAPPLFAVETGGHGAAVVHDPPASADVRPVDVAVMCGEGTQQHEGVAAVIEIVPRALRHAAIRYGVYHTPFERALVRVDIDAAAVLEPAPRDARVVFVMDGSYSTGDAALAAQLALARGYLAHVPDARFEIVVFRRHAERLVGGFAPAHAFEEAARGFSAHRLALGNGSNLDEGVALAANLLADTRGPARIVVFTDGRTRESFTPALAIAALAALPPDSVAHVALRTASYGELAETRVDDHPLAAVATAYGGIALDVTGEPDDPALVAQTMLGLVRPIRIDQFAISAEGVEELAALHEGALHEGTGERHMRLLSEPPPRLHVTGMIWGRRWQRTVEVSRAFSDALPAAVFGHALHGELTDDEQRAAARRGGAVSPVTSYLEAEQHLVPIPDDLRDFGGLGISGYGVCGCGGSSSTCTSCGGGGLGIGGYGVWEDRPTPEQLLAGWLRPRLAMCGRAAGVERLAVSLTIEGTGDEIVDVRVEGELPATARSCLADAAWELRLTSEFSHAHGYYTVELGWDGG